MNPLHLHITHTLQAHLKTHPILVWYDPPAAFTPFLTALGAAHPGATLDLGPAPVTLLQSTGSLFELRALAEPLTSGDTAQPVILYIPGIERDPRNSPLMELEKAGHVWSHDLRQLAREVLLKKYTQGVVDELLPPDRPAVYADLAAACAETSAEPPSVLKTLYQKNNDDILVADWLANDANDGVITSNAPASVVELTKLLRARLGVDLAADSPVAKLRAITARYVLANEFRSDLACEAPASLQAISAPTSPEQAAAVRAVSRLLRTTFAAAYPALADRVQDELSLAKAKIPPEALGSVDTFRFEERALLAHSGTLVATKRFAEAIAVVDARERSFWLDRDLPRKAQWDACRLMAELGLRCKSVGEAITKMPSEPAAWVRAYTDQSPAGWHRLDQAQRRLEVLVATLHEEVGEKPLGVVRRLYEDTCHAMAEGFTKALVKGEWTVPGELHQTQIFSEVVSAQPKRVAYFFVDAMRYEMGLDLFDRLPSSAEVAARAAVTVLPSITPLGMAALLPGAAKSFSVVEEKGQLGSRIDDSFLPGLPARKKLAAARIPALFDIALDDLLSWTPKKLAKEIESAQVIIVRSQELDHAGEAGFKVTARGAMDSVIDNLARAVRKLSVAGVEHSVITADHGHLFFADDRDESMRLDAPTGAKVELHRRCWIGRGGNTPSGCVRVSATALGYVSDLDFIFPVGSGVFKAGGDLAFHHGGPSLQEMIVPVITVRLTQKSSVRPGGKQGALSVDVSGVPEAVTNRIFSVTLQLGKNLDLFAQEVSVRPSLVSSGKQVGLVGLSPDATFDRASGCLTLHPGKPATVAFLLNNAEVSTLRILVQDPSTDAELYRSAEIPVRVIT
jgi:hypothetical protein